MQRRFNIVAIELFLTLFAYTFLPSRSSESTIWRTKASGRGLNLNISTNPNIRSVPEITSITWPQRDQIAIVEGDIMLGGLMMVHERDDRVICGKIMKQGGLQAIEAMLYTLDRINAMGIIPGVTLGARIKDDCDRDIYGLEQSVDFIRGK